jgi:hypothetical protein
VARRSIRDDDGKEIVAGDQISFAYGIPPVGVEAMIVERKGRLVALTPDHNPKQATLGQIRKWYSIYKLD